MRKTATLLLIAGGALLLAAPAFAVNLLSETFSYANGNLVPNGGWATHSGTGTDIQVVSGAANGNMSNAPDDNRTFTSQPITAKTYVCFKCTIGAPSGTPSTNYFLHLKDATTTNFIAKVFVAPQGTSFAFGVSVISSTVPVVWPTALNYGQEYYVVLEYDPTAGFAGNALLWVNPVTESDTHITATSTSGSNQTVSAVALRQSNSITPAGSTLWTYTVDDLGVGTTFADACVSGPVPTTNSTWGHIKTLYR